VIIAGAAIVNEHTMPIRPCMLGEYPPSTVLLIVRQARCCKVLSGTVGRRGLDRSPVSDYRERWERESVAIGGAAAGPDERKGLVMTLLSAPAQTLLGSDAVAHVWTNNADGSPQVSVVWVIVDGDEILFGSDRDSWKVRNLRRDPHIVLSIEDETRNEHGFQRHLVVRGQAEIEEGANPGLMDRLAKKYAGLDRHPLAARDSDTAVSVRVKIDRISGVGPWLDTS
jgi:PPOX class probable F420-dependent enzyme